MVGDSITVDVAIHVSDNPSAFERTVDALRQYSPPGTRITVLADAPDPATVEAIRASGLPVLRSDEPAGAPAMLNRFFRQTATPIVIYLQNGSLVAPYAIERLAAALSDLQTGLAGPSTNDAWNEQGRRIDPSNLPLTVRTLEPLYSLCSFCYAVKRDVHTALNGFDEAYGLGPCWEMDFNVRAARSGFRGVWVGAAYVARLPQSTRLRTLESHLFEHAKSLFQDRFCGRRLRGERGPYRSHCLGDMCSNFAPRLQVIRPAPVKISCIMPTAGRRGFVPAAIASFLAQDYRESELIVLDGGPESVADLIPDNPRIRHIFRPDKRTLGERRNDACELASGEIIAHWDDDDWYPSWRLSRQAAAITGGAAICGSSRIYFYDPAVQQAFLYQYPGAGPWVAGSTLAYRKSVWREHPFPPVQIGEDSRFIWSVPNATVEDLADPRLCVARIHSDNTSRKLPAPPSWSPASLETVRALVASYESSAPLVSCIMVTRDRRPFLPLSLRLFQAQDYPNKELIVVDDGEDNVEDIFTGAAGVRYIRAARGTSIGEKRNRGYAESRGAVLVSWDDDDWHAAERLRLQAAPILAGRAEVTGLHSYDHLLVETGECWEPSASLHRRMFVGDVHGGTLAIARNVFEAGVRCPPVNLAEDAALLRAALQAGHRLQKIDERGLFVYVRHGGNTWRFQAGEFMDPASWTRTQPPEAFQTNWLSGFRSAAELCARGPLSRV